MYDKRGSRAANTRNNSQFSNYAKTDIELHFYSRGRMVKAKWSSAKITLEI